MRLPTEPKFDRKGRIVFVDYESKSCYLAKETWEIKLKYPNREFFKYNFEKIELTITYPEEVRRSTKNKHSKILYRRFDRITIKEDITVPWKGYFVVIINTKSGRVQTFYPTRRKKTGEILWKRFQ